MAEDRGIGSKNCRYEILRNFGFPLCFSDCDKEEACSFAAVTPADAEILCDLYSAAEVNFNCTTSGLVKTAVFKNLFTVIL